MNAIATPFAAAPLLEVRSLSKYFPVRGGLFNRVTARVHAVEQVSFQLRAGSTLGVVGESGCGKSTTARLLMCLMSPDSGDMLFDGKRVGAGADLSVRDLRRQMQMVFQDSYASLNPRLTIEDSIAFGPTVHGAALKQARDSARQLLAQVGLEPNLYVRRYPHELSGGQRQRVNIARALALEPRLLILDEAVSALDKSVQAQVLNLLADLKQKLGLTYLFISHDLNVVRYISDQVMVMYLGKIAEIGPVEQVYGNPQHPYTKALFAANLSPDPDRRKCQAPLSGDPPNPINPPPGCRFRSRCPHAEALCGQTEPALAPIAGGQFSACHMVIPNSGHSQAPQGATA